MADMHTNLCASRTFIYSVARSCDAGHTNRKDCAAVVLYCSEATTKAALDAIQILGKLFIRYKTQYFSYTNMRSDFEKGNRKRSRLTDI